MIGNSLVVFLLMALRNAIYFGHFAIAYLDFSPSVNVLLLQVTYSFLEK